MDVNLLKDHILLGSLIDKRVGWVEHVAYLENKGSADSVLERKHWENRPLWIPRHKWEDNFKTDLKGIWWEGTDYIHLAQDGENWRSLVNMVRGLWVQQNAGSLLTSWRNIHFTGTTLIQVNYNSLFAKCITVRLLLV